SVKQKASAASRIT
ncbi:aminopeptidase N domain protein, partial [Vibrio parahaemolyticus AQ3810]